MPTAKPRVQVSLSTSQYELLKRLAKLQSRSMSAIVEELLEQVMPVLERVAVVLQAAVRAQDSMKEGLRAATDQAERETRPLLASALGQLDLLQMDFERAAIPAESASAASEPRGSRTPVAVTRGSGFATDGGKARKSPKRGPKRAIPLLRRSKPKLKKKA
jgi:hypothetical protein